MNKYELVKILIDMLKAEKIDERIWITQPDKLIIQIKVDEGSSKRFRYLQIQVSEPI